MKTTLNLNDEVLRRAKDCAARAGIALSQYVEDALRAKIAASQERPAYRLTLKPVQGSRPPNVDIMNREALYDVIDRR